MKVIEEFDRGKSSNAAECEDGIVVSDDFAAVIDGATDKRWWPDREGRTGGRVAMEACCAAIESLPSAVSAYEVVEAIGRRVWQATVGVPVCRSLPRWRFLHQLGARFPGPVVADVSFGFSGVAVRPRCKQIDVALASARAVALETYLREGYSVSELQDNDLGRQSICSDLGAAVSSTQRRVCLGLWGDRWIMRTAIIRWRRCRFP